MIDLYYDKEKQKFFAETPMFEEAKLLKRAGFRKSDPRNYESPWETTTSIVAGRIAKTASMKQLVADVKREIEHPAIRGSFSDTPAKPFDRLTEQKLYPFQAAGVEQLYYRLKCINGALLADDMGLGKTAQAIKASMLRLIDRQKRILVVCTATLKANWAEELKTWGSATRSVGIAVSNTFPDTDIVIINYDILGRHREKVHSEEWSLVIVDEAHNLKNKNAQRTVALYGKANARKQYPAIRADYRICITGTPILNRPAELVSSLRFLDPDTFHNSEAFLSRYCTGYEGRFRNTKGATNMEELQYLLRSRVMVRREKNKVLTQLPAKVRQIVSIQVEGVSGDRAYRLTEALEEQAKLAGETSLSDDSFRSIAKWLRANLGIGFEDISRLRKEEGVAKLPHIIAHLEECFDEDPDEPVIFMAHHTEVLSAVREHFAPKMGVSMITGKVDPKLRKKQVDQFQSGTNRLFIGSIGAAGEGITLTRAALMVFGEIDWVPGSLWQVEDRFHRIGQERGTLVRYLVTAGGIDEYMLRTVLRKQSMIDAGINTLVTKQ